MSSKFYDFICTRILTLFTDRNPRNSEVIIMVYVHSFR